MSYTLPSLPYAYDALEPHFDKQTMEIHHTKHHQTYVNNANAALESLPEFANLPVEELITKLDQLPADKKTVLRNNAGGHANHSLFWKGLKKGTTLQGDLKAAIERDFGTVDNFKAEFENSVYYQLKNPNISESQLLKYMYERICVHSKAGIDYSYGNLTLKLKKSGSAWKITSFNSKIDNLLHSNYTKAYNDYF